MENKEKTTEELLASISEDSIEFNLLTGLDAFLERVVKKFALTETIKGILDGEITLFILKQRTEGEFRFNISENLIVEKFEREVSDLLNEIFSFLKPILTNKETLEVSINKPVTAVSPLQALEGIKARLAQNTAITPSARDYSVEKIQTPVQTEKTVIDPYREAPID